MGRKWSPPAVSPRRKPRRSLVALARALLDDPRIGWISVTDNPGGGPMLPPDWLAGQVAGRGGQVVVHLTCKDANRNGLEAAAWRYASEGFHNILAITGDYPTAGFGGPAEPVFDLDSRGPDRPVAEHERRAGRSPAAAATLETLPKTDFFIGCVVSPFKRHERELMPQYFKLLRKIAAGAQWVIPQLGYDMRKFHEVKLLLASRGIQVPVVGNVYLLEQGRGQAVPQRQAGRLRGQRRVAQRVREVRRRARQGARSSSASWPPSSWPCSRGWASPPATWAASPRPETFGEIIDLAESFGPDDWREFIREIQFSQPDEFFLFEHDPDDGPERADADQPASIAARCRSRRASKAGDARTTASRGWCTAWPSPATGGCSACCGGCSPAGTRSRACWAALAYGVERRLEAAAVRLPGLRRLQPARLRLSLPAPRLLEGRPQRALRRLGQRPLRAGRQGMFLGPRLRAAEGLRRIGADARPAGGDSTMPQLKNTSSWANFYLDRDHSAGPASRPAPTREERSCGSDRTMHASPMTSDEARPE